ncbi:hypothetical protein NDU88_002129 [Pleurodeles waltl]|uniref:Uncharacterized protein n=1 Tax=Pleurodeles waltl TaxID=8319 RepID=A0AAV7UAF3_PLEWA|nr:hypothetical protein NDU88_002129 [Pleurodeles waltl]
MNIKSRAGKRGPAELEEAPGELRWRIAGVPVTGAPLEAEGEPATGVETRAPGPGMPWMDCAALRPSISTLPPTHPTPWLDSPGFGGTSKLPVSEGDWDLGVARSLGRQCRTCCCLGLPAALVPGCSDPRGFLPGP